tara:strand:+ start:225 stop:1088 length:864 start_codon:yes stop_codon:yes gene_type:complete
MSYPSICIAGIDIELIQNLKKGICISNSQQTIEVRPLLKENHKWNIDEHGTINLYSVYEFEGEYISKDFSKEDFYINSFKISDEIYELKNLSDDYYQIAENHFECCDGFLLINELIITNLPKKFSPFSKPHVTLGIYEGIVGNIYLKGNQWRGDVNPHAFLDESSFCGDIPITDIRFYDVKNNFKAKSLEEIKTQFTFDEHEQINGLISLGLSREFNPERWLQINTIHPEELFLNDKKYTCPLCSAEVNDYTNSKPSYNFPIFRCSNEKCDQGNGFPWSSWNPNEFN